MSSIIDFLMSLSGPLLYVIAVMEGAAGGRFRSRYGIDGNCCGYSRS